PYCIFFFQAEDGIRVFHVTGVQTCALPISFFEPTSQALMADVSRPEQRLRIFNLRYVAINVGMVVGPVIGSYLYYLVGTQVFLYTGTVYAIYLFFLFRILLKYRRDAAKRGGE